MSVTDDVTVCCLFDRGWADTLQAIGLMDLIQRLRGLTVRNVR